MRSYRYQALQLSVPTVRPTHPTDREPPNHPTATYFNTNHGAFGKLPGATGHV